MAPDAGAQPERARPAPSAPVSAGPPPGCPEDEGDPEGFVRPSVWELLRTRTHELRDRLPQLSRDASPALRAGLNGIGGDDPVSAVDELRRAPDRERDGFDIALAAMLHLGMRALARAEGPNDAAYWTRAALREAPDDPMVHALASLAASHAHRTMEATREMRIASRGADDEPAVALALARLEAEGGRFDEAVAAADRYLEAVPDDARIRSWRERMQNRAELTRAHARRSWDGIDLVWPDGALSVDRANDLMQTAADALREVAQLLGRARRVHLTVVVYLTPEDMRRATCAPSWSGGIYDGVLHLDARTIGGPAGRRVVRHESTHAQLALVRGRIPTWLNEGLAQHMEGDPSAGVRASWARMARGDFWIPLASLEGELLLIDDPGDAGLAYHQSLAMVLVLLERAGPGALDASLERVEAGEPEDLLSQLAPGTDGAEVLAFMRRATAPRGGSRTE